ncbi:MAG: hypothetical protein HRU38_18120 [Saccharospirillaceae bacterium]|nr:hypothetical protein [Pseudomonadales bacterium]NRB80555.1 hypothetical protein [Saccharospirillaceae bacterium]
MHKTLLAMAFTIISSMSIAGSEPTKKLFGYPFKVSTDVFVWANAINAEIEVVTQPNLTAGIGMKIGGFGSHVVVNARYYINEAQLESAFFRTYVSLPLLTGGDIGYAVLGGYQFVFDRKFFVSAQIGVRTDFELEADITLGLSI